MRKLSDQEQIFMRKIEECAGKQAHLWVVRRLENESRRDEAESASDRDSLFLRQREQLRQEYARTRNVVYAIERLLKQAPVPLDEIRRLVEEELSAKAPRDPAAH